MSTNLRAGVIGAGVFGGYHAKQYAGLENVRLTTVFDVDADRAQALAGPLGARPTTDISELIAASDVVTVASPAFTHVGHAVACLAAGKATYVEKPIAVTLEEADRIVAAAAKAGVICASGHLERAVFRAMGLLDIPERPLLLESIRNGPPGPRSLDVSVVLDLMIHDLDLALVLAAGDAVTVEAEGALVLNDRLDQVRAEATFEGGFTAIFESSRVAPARERRMKVAYPSGEVRIDFVTREFVNTTPFQLNANFQDTVAGKDPLGASLRAFLAAVRGEADRPLATAAEGAKALDLALAVEQAVGN